MVSAPGDLNEFSFVWDATEIEVSFPAGAIVVADTELTVGDTSDVTIAFSSAVSCFDNSDLTVESGTLSTVSSNDGGVTWTVILSPSVGISDTTNLITLNNIGVTNASGNTGLGTTASNNYAVATGSPPPPEPDPNSPTSGADVIVLPSGGAAASAAAGPDTVFGREGNDSIHGNTGDDSLAGGGGADLFNFSGGAGRNVVSDFSHAEGDHIRISTTDAADFTALSAHMTTQGADTVIALGPQTIVLVGISAGSLVAADFVFG